MFVEVKQINSKELNSFCLSHWLKVIYYPATLQIGFSKWGLIRCLHFAAVFTPLPPLSTTYNDVPGPLLAQMSQAHPATWVPVTWTDLVF